MVLEHSKWKGEEYIYRDKPYRDLRKKYISEFSKSVKYYKEGNIIEPDGYFGDAP
ncbi:MAG: hypothetical protein ACFFDK_19045 [Promethearchaeota archaeon]